MRQQMCINLQDVSKSGMQWQWNIPAESMMQDEGSVDPLSDVCQDASWQGSIDYSHAVYTLRGLWEVKMIRQCDRCLCDFEWLNRGECQREYSLQPLVDRDEEELLDIEELSLPGVVNLLDVLREEVWLAWKPCVVCSEACKGLCQGCGINLNHGSCQCGNDRQDHPFAALAKIKFDT